ncbi:hypothetical protein KKE26_05985 [bacterium]|nr:hypothetical protein [bacterium]
MRIVSDLSFFWHIEPVLLRSQSLMRLVGFNGRQIRMGTCNRGIDSKATNDNQDLRDDSPEIRGPICADSVAAYIDRLLRN